MAKRLADVKIETSIDLKLDERIEGAAIEVFDTATREMRQAVLGQWSGWKYKGRRLETTGRSHAAWRFDTQATEDPRTITFTNKARSHYGNKPYAAHVGRTKTARKEWLIVRDMLVDRHLPRLRDRMIQAIKDAIRTPGRRVKVRENKTTSYNKLKIS